MFAKSTSYKGKGKRHPITGHEGPEGEQMNRYILPSTALDGGGWSTPHPGHFTPRETDPVPIVQEVG